MFDVPINIVDLRGSITKAVGEKVLSTCWFRNFRRGMLGDIWPVLEHIDRHTPDVLSL